MLLNRTKEYFLQKKFDLNIFKACGKFLEEIKDTGDCLHNELLSKQCRKFKAESLLKKYKDDKTKNTNLQSLQISNYRRKRNRENGTKFNPFLYEQKQLTEKAKTRLQKENLFKEIDDEALNVLKLLREGIKRENSPNKIIL